MDSLEVERPVHHSTIDHQFIKKSIEKYRNINNKSMVIEETKNPIIGKIMGKDNMLDDWMTIMT